MSAPSQEDMLESFRKEVHERSHEIDPDAEFDWYDLSLGYALGKGASPEEARQFAATVRFHTDMG